MRVISFRPLLAIGFAAVLSACGSANESTDSSAAAQAADDDASSAASVKAVSATALQRDALVLLIPDGSNESDWPIKVWTDTAKDEGYRIQTINDSTFLGMGATASQKIKALIIPDSAHERASDALITALTNYVNGGGNLMVTYDAGVLTDTGFYAQGRSRLSTLVGVDYCLYDTLLDQTIGVGPVVGTKDRLTTFNFPPGKYVTFTGALTGSPALKARPTLRYLPASPSDAGGQKRAEPFTRNRPGTVLREASPSARSVMFNDHAWVFVNAQPRLPDSAAIDEVRADGNEQEPTRPDARAGAPTGKDTGTTLETISGYLYSSLDYYSFVTSGTYQGTAMLASPSHGVVSGWRTQGAGKVMFVNIPLGYFKAIGTDSAPIHGSMSLFARNVASLPRLSSQPKGVGGLVYNWHVDAKVDLNTDAKWLLDNTNVFKRGPYSIHFTAGPDVATVGDGLGMNLPANPAGRDIVRRLGNIGAFAGKLPVNHQLGSHGGWNHDLYGENASETNQTTYQPWLTQNANAVEGIMGKVATEYSAPQGNNPLWALTWLQNRGTKGYYYAGDIGTAAVRAYRDGAMRHPSMWAFPVTPQGMYATFEEFEDFNVSDATTLGWLSELQDFVVSKRTNRLIYNHPPGARRHVSTVVEPMLARADSLKAQGKFNWYSITDQAVFMTRRNAVTWNVTSNGAGKSTFTASHSSDLSGVAVLVPKNRYSSLRVTAGSAAVSGDTTDWLVVVNSGKSVSFTATEL